MPEALSPKLAALRAAFVNGYHTDVDANTGEIRQQDGFVSSLVTFAFILPLGFSICVSHWITLNSQTKDVDRTTVDFLKITYMVFSIVIMLILRFSTGATHLYATRKKDGNGIPQQNENLEMELRSSTEQSDFWRKIRGGLPLIGLGVFYAIGIFRDLSRIAANFSCLDTFRQCHLLKRYIVNIAYHSTKILFMGVLMLFSIFFKQKVILQCCTTRFCLVFIMAAAATVWFDITLSDALVTFSSKKDSMENACFLPNASHQVLVGQLDMHCVNESTGLYQTVHKMSPYLYPLNIEFLLLCIEILLKLFFTMKPQVAVNMLKHAGQGSRGHQQCINHGQRSLEPETELFQDNASTQLLVVGQGAGQEVAAGGAVNYGAIGESHPRFLLPGTHSPNNTLLRSETTPNVTGKIFAIWCLMAIIINALFIAFGAMTYLNQAPDIWNDIYQITKIIYWISLLGSLAVAYIAMQDMASDFHEFRGLEITVVFSVAGFALSAFFPLISAVSVLEGSLPVIPHYSKIIPWYDLFEYPKSYMPQLVISDNLLNIIQVFFQSNLLLQAARVKRRESSTGNVCFSVAIVYLAICNLTLWIIDSFVLKKNPYLGPTQEFYLGQHAWHLIVHLTIPFVLFYRFNCGIIFLEILF